MRSKLPIIVVFLLFTSALGLAQQSGGEFAITSNTIDSGGGTSAGGEFSLTGTIGQPDANPQFSAGGEFFLAGGFWANAVDLIFKNGFEGDKGEAQ